MVARRVIDRTLSALFDVWYEKQSDDVQKEMAAYFRILEKIGPQLGRPHVDQVKASQYKNMKEFCVQIGGHPFRAFFAFDPERKAIVTCAGDKKGEDENFSTNVCLKLQMLSSSCIWNHRRLKMMETLKEMMAKRSPESRARIESRAAEIRQKITLARLREELSVSHTHLAEVLGAKQPSVAKIENVDSDPKLSTALNAERYIAGLGGKLTLDVTLPDDRRIALSLLQTPLQAAY